MSIPGCACVTLIVALAGPAAGAQNFPCPALTRVGVSDVGYSSYQEDGEIRGAAVDLVAQMGQRSGCKMEIAWFPRRRLFTEFESGHLELVMSAVQTPQRDRAGAFQPYVYTVFDLLLSKRGNTGFTSLTEFTNASTARLNLTRGSAFTPEVQRQIDRLESAGRIEWVSDYGVAFTKMAMGRTDGTISSPIIYLWHMRHTARPDQIAIIALPEARRQPVGMYLSNRTLTPPVQQAFIDLLRQMVKDDAPRRAYAAYLDSATMTRLFGSGLP